MSFGFIPALDRLPRIIMIFFLIDIGLCVAYVINYLIGHSFMFPARLLDLDHERSLASWYSTTQLFCIFATSALFSYHKIKENGYSIALVILPAMFLLMSIDESVSIHEWLGKKSDILFTEGSRKGTLFDKTGIWMLVFGLPFFAFFLFLAHSLKRHFIDNPSSLKKMVVGMVIMLIGALGIETFSNFSVEGYIIIEVVFEEFFEMLGATVMLWAVYEMNKNYIRIFDQ